MKKLTIILFLSFIFSAAYSQGDFVLEKRTGKYIYQEEFSKYDRKLIVDFVRNQTTGKWLIKKAEKWGLFSSKLGMLIQPEYDTIIILPEIVMELYKIENGLFMTQMENWVILSLIIWLAIPMRVYMSE